MEVWGFTAGLLDAILEASGLALPWDVDDVRPLPESAIRPYRLPGSANDEDDDAAAPTVADPPPDGPPTRTVPGR
jgi:hypothetical protein